MSDVITPESKIDFINHHTEDTSKKHTNLKVSVGGKEIYDGERLPLKQAIKSQRIEFDKKPGRLYTLLMVDPDAPSRENPIYKYWLHRMIINNNQEIMEYQPPDPPKGSGPHRYFFFLYEQKNKIDASTLPEFKRPKFNLPDFIYKHNLNQIDAIHFITENPK